MQLLAQCDSNANARIIDEYMNVSDIDDVAVINNIVHVGNVTKRANEFASPVRLLNDINFPNLDKVSKYRRMSNEVKINDLIVARANSMRNEILEYFPNGFALTYRIKILIDGKLYYNTKDDTIISIENATEIYDTDDRKCLLEKNEHGELVSRDIRDYVLLYATTGTTTIDGDHLTPLEYVVRAYNQCKCMEELANTRSINAMYPIDLEDVMYFENNLFTQLSNTLDKTKIKLRNLYVD
jgi:hypothetical protein